MNKDLDFAVNIDVLRFCLGGWSNQAIADALGLDKEFVIQTIHEHLGFAGFTDSCFVVSPWFLYKKYKNKDVFIEKLSEYLLKECIDIGPEELYNVIDKFEKEVIEKEL